MRVKDMPRDQQKAVFANMGTGSNSSVLEGTAPYEAKRRYLLDKADLEETTEDKIFTIMNNPKLTHRQKMDRIADIKENAAKKLKTMQPASYSSAGTTSEPAKIGKQAQVVVITSVPSGIERQKFNSMLLEKQMGKNRLYEHEGLLLTQEEYVQGLKQNQNLPAGSKVIRQPTGQERGTFDDTITKRPPQKTLFVSTDGLMLDGKTYAGAVKRRGRVQYNKRNWEEKHRLEQNLAIKQAKESKVTSPGQRDIYAKALAKHEKSLDYPDYLDPKKVYAQKHKGKTYNQLKQSGIKLKPAGDIDKDNVPNAKDCRPLDSTKQDRGRRMKKKKALTMAEKGLLFGGRAITGYLQKKYTPEGRAKEAQKRVNRIKAREKEARLRTERIRARERAEQAETEAKQAETEYKKTHPSFFDKAKVRFRLATAKKEKSIYD